MTLDEIEEIRPQSDGFAATMLGSLPRLDQRGKGELYVRGLLTDRLRLDPKALTLA